MASLHRAQAVLDSAVDQIFDADARVQAVGIGKENGEFVIRGPCGTVEKLCPLRRQPDPCPKSRA